MAYSKTRILLLALAGFVAQGVFAEGSYQAGLNQPLQDFAGGSGHPQFVDIVTPGEVINVSLCGATNANTVSVQILDPDGISVYSSGTVAGNVDCADPFTAPLLSPIRYVTAASGTYTVRMENVSGGTDIKRFDITVTPDAVTNPDPTATGGRLWAYGWDFYTRSFAESASTFADYYALVPGGRPSTNYVWKLDLNNFSGNLYNLVANDLGLNPPIRATACQWLPVPSPRSSPSISTIPLWPIHARPSLRC